jgi:RND family efflux transporter MFP subunit
MRLWTILLFSMGLTACHWHSSKQQNIVEVKVIEPVVRSQPFVLHYIGIVKSIQNVNIQARVDGYLQERLFKDGDVVQKDQLLYRIDARPYQAELLSAQGAMDKAKADLVFQELQYHRYETMLSKKAVSKAAYDQQYASYLAAKGQLELAQGNYQKAKINLDFCEIRSPMDGLAGKNLVDPGNLISIANQPKLLNVVKLDPIRVEFNPSSADLKWFYQFNQYHPFKVQVKIPNDSKHQWQGVVDFYNNVVSANTGTVLLRATLDNKPMFLRPDLYVNLEVILNPAFKFTLVPSTQVQSIQGLFQIQVVDASHHLVVRNLVLGEVHQAWVQVISGLKQGDLIVSQPTNLAIGSLVNPKIITASVKAI